MRSGIPLFALGLGVYLAVSLATLPAAVAYRWFAPEELSLAVVDGTVWRGSALYGGVSGLPLSNLEWQLHPAALLAGRINVTVQAEFAEGFANAELMLSRNRMLFSQLTASTRLQTFAGLLPLGDVRGQISLRLEQLEFIDNWPVVAIGEARIADLAIPPLVPIAGVSLVSLGNFSAQFAVADQPGIAALLSDQGGPLELTGRLNLAPDRRYVIDSLIRTRPEASRELVQGIEFVTESPNASGQRRFVLEGSL
jgi:hypothetical protein